MKYPRVSEIFTQDWWKKDRTYGSPNLYGKTVTGQNYVEATDFSISLHLLKWEL